MARLFKVLLSLFAAAVLACIVLAGGIAVLQERQHAVRDHAIREHRTLQQEAEQPHALRSGQGRAFSRGIDVEASLDDAVVRAGEVVYESLRRRGRRIAGSRVYVRARRDHAEDIARRLMVVLRQRHGMAAINNSRRGANVVIDVDVQRNDDLGLLLVLSGGVDTAIAIDDSLFTLAENIERLPMDHIGQQRTIRFKTGPTLDEESAVEDGRDLLAERIVDHLTEMALVQNWMSLEKRERFQTSLRERYPRDVLVGLGHVDVQAHEMDFDGGHHYSASVTWTANERELGWTARSVAKALIIEDREPWIKLGLSVAFLILAILGWLRLDWWLKGHHSFLTKLAFAMLYVAGLGVLWSIELHA